MAGFCLGRRRRTHGCCGRELLIPTIVLLFGIDITIAGSLSPAVSLPARIVAVARYSRDGSFVVLRRHARLVIVLAVGSVVGTVVGGLLLGRRPRSGPRACLAGLLLLSSVKVWRHATAD